MNLSIRNQSYTDSAPHRIKSRDLYGGNASVKAKSTTYLFQEKNETSADYELRLKRACIDNYVEKIIQARQSVLFLRPHTRDLDASLDAYIDDVDASGTNAATFFADVARDAQIDGLRWVLVDMPRLEEPPNTRADEIAAGIRPFFQSVPASSVIDWEVGADNKLNWAVIEQWVEQPREPFEPTKCIVEYKVWRRDGWELHRSDNPDSRTSQVSMVAEGPNPTGMVPLVPFYGIKSADFFGLPACFSILDQIILVYNKESDLDWFQRLYCHPVPYVISPKPPGKMDTASGFWIESSPQSGEIKCDYLQTSGDGETSVRASIEKIEAKIYAIALAQAKRDGKQVQAADSMREDRRVFNSSLKTASEQLQRCETACWQLMAAWLGKPGAQVNIAYSRDFNDRNIDDAMLAALGDLVDSRKLSLETFHKTLEHAELLPDFDAEKEQQLLAAEASKRAVELLSALDKNASGGA